MILRRGPGTRGRERARSIRLWLLGLLVVASAGEAVGPAAGYVRPAKLKIVSIATDGTRANNGSEDAHAPGLPVVSAGGRYVAFASAAANLVPGDRNLAVDVFRRDLKTGRTELVSRGLHGLPAAGGCAPDLQQDPKNALGYAAHPSISADGRYVAFRSCFINLSAGDTNVVGPDIFVRDMDQGSTVLASTEVAADTPQLNFHSGAQAISATGRYVTFLSSDVTGSNWQPYVRDLKRGRTRPVAISNQGEKADRTSFVVDYWQDSTTPAISGNGRVVAFSSHASNLVAGDLNLGTDVFVRDLRANKTEMVDVANDGSVAQGSRPLETFGAITGYTISFGPRISFDGNFVAFTSFASNLVPNDGIGGGSGTTTSRNIFVRDRRAKRTVRVDVTSAGADRAGGISDLPQVLNDGSARLGAISRDGRFVTFGSHISLTEDVAASSFRDQFVYVHDRTTGATEVVRNFKSMPAGSSGSYTQDGRYIAFAGKDVTTPGDTNQHIDIFRTDRGRPLAVNAVASVDAGGDASEGGGPEADIVGASVLYRPEQDDLYVKIDVDRLSGPSAGDDRLPAIGALPVLYGLRFTVDGVRYEVRAASTASFELPAPAFGLFRCDPVCREVASLRGGLGTVGDSIVTVVPVAQIGSRATGRIDAPVAFSSVGTYGSGVAQGLDAVALPRLSLRRSRD